jgi:hypothetical protein
MLILACQGRNVRQCHCVMFEKHEANWDLGGEGEEIYPFNAAARHRSLR